MFLLRVRIFTLDYGVISKIFNLHNNNSDIGIPINCTVDAVPRRSPSTETNGQSFLRRPGPTKGCRANDDDSVPIR